MGGEVERYSAMAEKYFHEIKPDKPDQVMEILPESSKCLHFLLHGVCHPCLLAPKNNA